MVLNNFSYFLWFSFNNYFKSKLIENLGLILSILQMYLVLFITLINNSNNNEVSFRFDLGLFNLGFDGININLVLMTVIVIPIVIIIRENTTDIRYQEIKGRKESKDNNITIKMLWLEIIIIMLFLVQDLISFYIFFELILIPMFIVINLFSGPFKYKRIEASYRLFIYTLLGSLVFLISIIIIYFENGTTNFELVELLLNNDQNYYHSLFIWFLFAFSFAIKVPIFPLHLWLPEAHTESPTTGSVILAAILLKIGIYGYIKFNLILLNNSINYSAAPILITFGLLSILYSNLLILRLVDIKKIIAYSSIIHMNYVVIGLFSDDFNSILGSYITLISHAFISSGLFMLIGILYRRYHTRNLLYYRGLFNVMPLFSFCLIFFILSNMSLPLTAAFPGEFLIILGTYKNSNYIGILISIILILSTTYNIWLLNRILFGQISIYLIRFKDLTLNEFLSLIPLFFFCTILGLLCFTIFNPVYLFLYYII